MVADPQDTPTNRPVFPYLKKGTGTQRRFGDLGAPMSSRSASVSTARSEDRRPASTSSLPSQANDFLTPQQRRPTTATTHDSGLPEDQMNQSNDSLGQHEDDDVFDVEQDEISVSVHPADNIRPGIPPNQSLPFFQPDYSSTPIAQEIQKCQDLLEQFAPNSVRNALNLMNEVETASSSPSLTSLNRIATPPIPRPLSRQTVSDGISDFSEQVQHRHPGDYIGLQDNLESIATTSVPPTEHDHEEYPEQSERSIALPRASDYRPTVSVSFDSSRQRSPSTSATDASCASFPGSILKTANRLDKLARSRGVDPDLIVTPAPKPKLTTFVSKPTPKIPKTHDISLLKTPILPNRNTRLSFDELETMAEQLRYQMMNLDIAWDKRLQVYKKRDAVREQKYKEMAQKCDNLKSLLDAANVDLRVFRDKEKMAKKKVDDSKKVVEDKDREVRDLKDRIPQMSSTISTMRLEADKQKRKIKELTTEKAELQDKLTRSNMLHSKLEAELRCERRMNNMHTQMNKQAVVTAASVKESVKQPVNNRRRPSNGRNPFANVGQTRGSLGSASSTGSSTNGAPLKVPMTPLRIPDEIASLRQPPTVVAVQRASKSVQWSSPLAEAMASNSHENIENEAGLALMQFVPDDACLTDETWDGRIEKKTFTTPDMTYLWSRQAKCCCETLLQHSDDCFYYCPSGIPVHLSYTASNGSISITLEDIKINCFPTEQLEILRGSNEKDRTIIMSGDRRYEYLYSSDSEFPIIDIFDGAIGRRKKRDNSTVAIDATGKTALRTDGSYCSFDGNKFTIEHPLFQLARSTNKDYGGAFGLCVYEPNSNKTRYLQINVCPKDSVVFIKHVREIGDSVQKDLCNSLNKCVHLKK